MKLSATAMLTFLALALFPSTRQAAAQTLPALERHAYTDVIDFGDDAAPPARHDDSEFGLSVLPVEYNSAANNSAANNSAANNSAANNNAANNASYNNRDPAIDAVTPHGSLPPKWRTGPANPHWPGVHDGNCCQYAGPSYLGSVPPAPPHKGSKSGRYQHFQALDTYVFTGDTANDMGIHSFEFKPTLCFKPLCCEHRLIVTPGLIANFFDGPTITDVPGETYDFYTDIRWLFQATPHFGIDVGLTPGFYSDLRQFDIDNSFRFGARMAGVVTLHPEFQFALGAMYLGRDDISVLPIAGIMWYPHDRVKVEMLFPRPKVSWRVDHHCEDPCGFGHHDAQHWLYMAGEFGGGSWAVQRANGNDDVLNYRDYRLIFGYERLKLYHINWRIETGFVFARAIDYKSNDTDIDLDNTFMARAEVRF